MDYRPHPTLKRYYADDKVRQSYVNRAFDVSARHYDRVNRVLSLGTDKRYRKEAIVRAGLGKGMRVLDVGCGTGLVAGYAEELVGPSGTVVGLDPSFGMLQQAVRENRVRRPVLGVAESLPFPDNTFDFLTMSYALRHVSDLAVAFTEFRRVLKPNGTVLLLELTVPPAGLKYTILKCWMKRIVPAITRVMTGSQVAQLCYSYCWDTFDQVVSPTAILQAMQDVGFRDARRHVELRVFSEYHAVK